MLKDLSRLTHKAVRGRDMSWCAWAYENRHYRVWRAFVWLMGEAHCERSWRHYNQ